MRDPPAVPAEGRLGSRRLEPSKSPRPLSALPALPPAPRLAVVANWGGPISASLAINFYLLKLAGGLQKQARVGLSRLDWVSCYQAAKSAAIEAQQWQRRLAVTTALLAVETDRVH